MLPIFLLRASSFAESLATSRIKYRFATDNTNKNNNVSFVCVCVCVCPQGSCVDPTCLYRHVKVNRQAQACPTFLRTGTCDKGDECPLKHPSRIGRAPVMAPADVSLSDQHRHCT